MAEVEAAFSTRRQDVLFGHMENFLCPSMSGEQARRLVYPKGVIAGYLPGACALRSDLFARVGGFDEKLRTGYFIEWMARARAAGVCERVSSKLALRRRIRSNTAGARSLQESGGLSADFLEIARRSIALKRNSAR
jgi:GT2 family glycosyltransferase